MTEQQVGQRSSYVAAANDLASVAEYWQTVKNLHGSPRGRELTVHIAAIRALATLVGQIEQTQRIIDEWRSTAITGSMSMREPLVLLESIAAGFTPRDPEAR